MARTKVKELDNRRQGDRRQCPMCNGNLRKRGRISASDLWAWTLRQAGPVKAFRR